MMNEPQVTKALQVFEWNYDTVRLSLSDAMAKYKDLLVTDENVEDMERARREVTKYRTAIQKFKKKGRDLYRRPMEEFTNRCDTLLDMVVEVERPLALQLAEYEDRRVQAAEQRAREYFLKRCEEAGIQEEYRGAFALLSKWANKTQKWSDTEADIEAQVSRCLMEQEAASARHELEALRRESLKAYAIEKSRAAGLVIPVTIESATEPLERRDLEYGRARIDELVRQQAAKEERMRVQEAPVQEAPAFEPFTITVRFTVRNDEEGRRLNDLLQRLPADMAEVVQDDGGEEG